MAEFFEIPIDVSEAPPGEAARHLHATLRAAILDGRLAEGAKLPPARHAKDYFGVSRNTAAEVYDRLLNEGLVVTRQGAGTYVAPRRTPMLSSTAALPDPLSLAERHLNPFWGRPEVRDAMGFWQTAKLGELPASALEDGKPATRSERIDFRPALVETRQFPMEIFRRVSAKQLRGLERRPRSHRSPLGNQGNRSLRRAITQHIAVTRAVVADEADVLVAAGAQQAFDILARALVRPGETVVAIEDPGYPPMRVAFAAAGARLVPIPTDDEGLRVDCLPQDVGIICVCPSHQFPLGMAMSSRRRVRLIERARELGAVIVEDDYDGEFRYDDGPLEALRATENADIVFYVGTFSKCMLPALRLGFIIGPPWAMGTMIATKNCLDWHCSTPVQLSVARFIDEGHLAHHVRRMRALYGQRRKLLLKLLEQNLSTWLQPVASTYGMHIAALAVPAVDTEQIAQILGQQGVEIHTLQRYFYGPAYRTGFVVGFGATDLDEIRAGLLKLEAALKR